MESIVALFGNIPSAVIALAGTAVGAFVVAVVIDDVLGVLVAIKAKTFDANKLPAFLESQFGTKQAAALAGAILVAVISGQYANLQDAALALVAAGGGALTLSVLADIYGKIKALAGLPSDQAQTPAAPAADSK
jgi:hypothetical protein